MRKDERCVITITPLPTGNVAVKYEIFRKRARKEDLVVTSSPWARMENVAGYDDMKSLTIGIVQMLRMMLEQARLFD